MRKTVSLNARGKCIFAHCAIFLFGAAAAWYDLFITSTGRVPALLGRPIGLVETISSLAVSLGRNGLGDMLSRLRSRDFVLAFLLFAAVCFFGELCFQGRKREAVRKQILRLLPAILVLFALLWGSLRLNTTSLFAWGHYIRGNHGYPLLGSARITRRDEFAIWTPMALSQEALGWPGINPLIGSGTDVTWLSMGGLPAWNAAQIFKPLYWGFLLLGSEKGLSFLTVNRGILLFAVSYAAAMRYTHRNKSMSIAAGFLLTLAPMVQWFISQSIAEVLIFSQGMVLSVDALLKSSTTRGRILCGLLTGWLLGCFVMIGYPAWLIPAMYLVIGSWIYLFVQPAVQQKRQKLACLLAGLLPSLVMLGIIIYGSWDTLQAVRNSAYPGSRLITGGLKDSSQITGGLWNPAYKIGLASLFFPLENMDMNASNYVDASVFLTFAPAGFALSVYHQIREKKADILALIMTGILGLFWLFTFVSLPAWLCKITLLSQCSRPVFPIQLCELLLLIRSRAKGGIRNPRLAAGAILGSAALNLGCILYFGIPQLSAPRIILLAVLYLFLFSLIYTDVQGIGMRFLAFSLCCTVFLAGGFVNPIQQGLEMLDDFDLVSTLKSIPDEPDDLYAMEGGFPPSNVPLLAGKHCINTDQPYADLNRWDPIDPERIHSDVFNRLAHVAVTLAEPGEESEFREEGNYIILRLTRADLYALGVNYLISPREELENAVIVARSDADGLNIWKLNGP